MIVANLLGSRRQDITKTPIRPFLIVKDDDGDFRLTVRVTRYNSQNYPVVTSTLQEQRFKTSAAARSHAKAEFGAEAGQFASK